MKIVVCVDDLGGMCFNRRRVSRDRVVLADVAKDLGGGFLYAAEYSRALLSECKVPLMVSDDFLDAASTNDTCFLEERGLLGYEEKIDAMTVYRWNRRYPSDLKLDVTPEDLGLQLVSTEELVGYSHERITKEVYKK